MNPLDKAEIGATGLSVTRLGMGGAPFGSMPREDAERQAAATIRAGLDMGIAYYDTAPLYGAGWSERYYAHALAAAPRDSFALSTKVGRVLNPIDAPAAADIFTSPPAMDVAFDFTRDGVLRSFRGKPQAPRARPHRHRIHTRPRRPPRAGAHAGVSPRSPSCARRASYAR